MRTKFHPRRLLVRYPTSLRTATSFMRRTRRRGCACPLAGSTFCAASQKSTGTIQEFRGEAALHGPHGKLGTGECVFFLVLLHTDDHGSLGRLGRALVMPQPKYAFERISCPVCSRSSHLESGTLFPLSLYLAVFVPGVWVLLRSTEMFFFFG